MILTSKREGKTILKPSASWIVDDTTYVAYVFNSDTVPARVANLLKYIHVGQEVDTDIPDDVSIGFIHDVAELDKLARLRKALVDHLLTPESMGRRKQLLKELGRIGLNDEYIQHIVDNSYLGTLNRGVRPGDSIPGGFFIEEAGCYFIKTQEGMIQLSTFILKPLRYIGGKVAAILCDIVTPNGTIRKAIPKNCFGSVKDFDAVLQAHLEIVWLGSDRQLKQLLIQLLRQLDETGLLPADSVNTIGLYKKDETWLAVYNRVVSNDMEWEPGDTTAPIYLVGESQIDIGTRICPDFNRINTVLLNLHKPETIWPMIGWYFSAFWKPLLLSEHGIRFPAINVVGTHGAGKTTLINIFMKIMGNPNPITWDSKTTPFVWMRLLGSTNNSPVAFAENRDVTSEAIQQHIRLAYDTGFNARGKPDQTVVEYPLTTPFSIDGEDMLGDPAITERIIPIYLNKSDLTPERQAFREQIAQLNFEGYFYLYIKYCLQLIESKEYVQLLQEAAKTIAGLNIPIDRIASNFTLVWFGILLFSGFTGKPVPSVEVIKYSLNKIYSTAMQRGRMQADNFIESVVNHVFGNEPVKFFAKHVYGRNGVAFQFAPAYEWWSRQRQNGFTQLALMNQLRELVYVSGPEDVDSRLCYIVDLRKARELGLDIPDTSPEVFHV